MPAAPQPLSELIHRANQTHSWPVLTARAIDPRTGTTASQGYLHNLRHGKVTRFPSLEHIGAIAAAIDMPFEVVFLAAIVQWTPETDGLRGVLDTQLARLIDEYDRKLTALDGGAEPDGDEDAAMVAEALHAIDRARRLLRDQQKSTGAA